MQQSNFVHPPPGFVRQPNVSSSSFYDQSMLNGPQILSPIGSKVSSGTINSSVGSFGNNNNLRGGVINIGHHQYQQPIKFFPARFTQFYFDFLKNIQ